MIDSLYCCSNIQTTCVWGVCKLQIIHLNLICPLKYVDSLIKINHSHTLCRSNFTSRNLHRKICTLSFYLYSIIIFYFNLSLFLIRIYIFCCKLLAIKLIDWLMISMEIQWKNWICVIGHSGRQMKMSRIGCR